MNREYKIVHTDTRPFSPVERMSEFKRQAAYHPELNHAVANQFYKMFSQKEYRNECIYSSR